MTADEIAARIEHTLLKPEATGEQVDTLCDEALSHGFRAVCMNPRFVRRAAERLSANESPAKGGRNPMIVSVAGFPLGASHSATKADEARRAMDDGATEIDMVAAIGALVAGEDTAVRKDIEAVSRVVHETSRPGILKVILETGVLTTEQIILGCRCCVDEGADFVKTSTGFHPCGGATVEHVRLLCRHASPILVKASGGIRSAATATAMLDAGAERLGTSAGVAILGEFGFSGC